MFFELRADSRKTNNSVVCYFNQILSCLVVEKWSKMLLKWKNGKKSRLLRNNVVVDIFLMHWKIIFQGRYYTLPFKFWLSLRTDIAVCNNHFRVSFDFMKIFLKILLVFIAILYVWFRICWLIHRFCPGYWICQSLILLEHDQKCWIW